MLVASPLTALAQPTPALDALPGALRVGSAELGEGPRLALIGQGGYGWIPGLAGEDGDHHRAMGTLALSFVPVEHVGVAAGLVGAWDVHPDDALGPDSSGMGALFVALRGGYRLPFGLALGGDARWDLSGADAPDLAVDAGRLSLRGLASYRPDDGDLTLVLNAGYRLDWSARTVEAAEAYRVGDRVSLNASAFDAVLVGAGAIWRIAPVELLLEVTFEPLVGTGAPDLDAAPLRVAAGGRVELATGVHAHLLAEVSTQRRVQFVTGAPLVASEPRVALLAALSWQPFFGAPPSPPEEEAPAETAEPERVERAVRGVVLDRSGAPVAGAEVSLTAEGAEEPSASAASDDAGRYRFDVAPGAYTLRVRSGEHEPLERAIRVGGAEADGEIEAATLAPLGPSGAIRGLVRDFRGNGLRARAIIEPGGLRATTDADGLFEVSVAPGEYDVEIRAPGFASQRRHVIVTENGVTILNADLRSER